MKPIFGIKNNKSYLDLKGKTFGKWRVISCDFRKYKRRYCKCKCKCGAISLVAAQTLINKTSTQCLNCYNKIRIKNKVTSHPLYPIWNTMHQRCKLKTHNSYKNYGARGIKVCKRWNKFDNFVKDMSPRPSKKHSLDRINNNGLYSPKNCRWATQAEQVNNKRNNRMIKYNGINKNISQWAKYLNIKTDTLYHFLLRNSFHRAYKFYKGKL